MRRRAILAAAVALTIGGAAPRIAVAASDDEIRVACTPFGVTVTMAIHDLSRIASELRNDIKRA